MSNTKVSVIIPVYNTEKYLKQCLDTIINQTLKEIEIICINDSSTDNSLSILEKYAKADNRITVINNVHTGNGATSARTAGLNIAKGEYISFLDSDGYFNLTLLEKTYNQAKNTDADMVIYDAVYFDDLTGSPISLYNILIKDMLPDKEVFSAQECSDTIFLSHLSVPWQRLLKREFIEREDLSFQSMYHADDFYFVVTALAVAQKITVVPEVLVHYRTNTVGNQGLNIDTYPLSGPEVCVEFKEFLMERGIFEDFKNGFANTAIRLCAWYLRTFKTYEAFAELYEALNETYIFELELENALCDDQLRFDAYKWMDLIKSGDKAEYLFFYMIERNPSAYTYISFDEFPKHKVKVTEKIALYGSNSRAKSFYIENLDKGYCQMVAWVVNDSDYDDEDVQIVSPMQSIEVLNSLDFDKVLIANQKLDEIFEAKKKLLDMGIHKQYILTL